MSAVEHTSTVGEVRAESRAWTRAAFLYLIFFVGGIPALMYQVVWQRVLTLYFGVDIYSTTIIVATFMLGLGLGSLGGGWLADRVQRPAFAYAAIELLMSVFGFISLALFASMGQAFGGSAVGTVIIADFLLLLVPTSLMGMTLPLMCRVVIDRDGSIGNGLSWLYGVNTFGAALGALLSSYVLIGVMGLHGATRLAASVNLLLAVAMIAAARRVSAPRSGVVSMPPPMAAQPETAAGGAHRRYWLILTFSFLSGFIALGYEIIWYRVLGVLLHGTVYVFGTILFFYLTGMALGSLLARKRIDEPGCIERFAACQLGMAAYTFVLFSALGYFSWLPPLRQVIGASFFTTFHPAPELFVGHVDLASAYSLLDIAGWSVLLLGVPAVLMGYGFTNLIREGSRHVVTLGRSVGSVYFANIVGATAGTLLIGFTALQYLGSEHSLKMLILTGSAIPISVFAAASARRDVSSQRPSRGKLLTVSVVLAVVTAVLFPGRTAIIRALHYADHDVVEFLGAEDRTGVSVLRRQHQVISFGEENAVLGQQRLYIDGSHHGDGSDAIGGDSGVVAALAAHQEPNRVLLIGLGDGQMAATAEQSGAVRELVIVELNGTLRQMLSRTQQGRTVLQSKKARYVEDDGRRWLLANPQEKFDLIMMFPLHAAHAFSGALYSIEFFEILRDHLNPGGLVFVRTVDMYSTAKTIATAFPYVIRHEKSEYIASTSELRFDKSFPDGASDPVVDRDVILAHTRSARINRDFAPNSEYYITYPFAASLQTRFPNPLAYPAAVASRLQTLVPGDNVE